MSDRYEGVGSTDPNRRAQRMDRAQAGFGMPNMMRNMGIKEKTEPTPELGSEEGGFFKWLDQLLGGKKRDEKAAFRTDQKARVSEERKRQEQRQRDLLRRSEGQ